MVSAMIWCMTAPAPAEPFSTLAARHLPAAMAARWTALLRPCTRLTAAAEGDAAAPAAAALGGDPLLPDGMAWPEWPGHGPLSFVASVDCAALPRAGVTASFPESGTLLFFYFDGQVDDAESVVFADDPETWAGARVLYIPAGTAVSSAPVPCELEPYDRVELVATVDLSAQELWHPQSLQALATEGTPSDLPDDQPAHVRTFLDAIHELRGHVGHQIGGHAIAVQNPVEYEIAHAVLGGNGVAWDDPRMDAEAQRWVLLAQFDSENAAGMMWGDCGTLYWLIRPEDLAARRFEAAMFTWQCC